MSCEGEVRARKRQPAGEEDNEREKYPRSAQGDRVFEGGGMNMWKMVAGKYFVF